MEGHGTTLSTVTVKAERKPHLAKEAKLYSQTITQLNGDGEKYRIAIQDFDDLEFC